MHAPCVSTDALYSNPPQPQEVSVEALGAQTEELAQTLVPGMRTSGPNSKACRLTAGCRWDTAGLFLLSSPCVPRNFSLRTVVLVVTGLGALFCIFPRHAVTKISIQTLFLSNSFHPSLSLSSFKELSRGKSLVVSDGELSTPLPCTFLTCKRVFETNTKQLQKT